MPPNRSGLRRANISGAGFAWQIRAGNARSASMRGVLETAPQRVYTGPRRLNITAVSRPLRILLIRPDRTTGSPADRLRLLLRSCRRQSAVREATPRTRQKVETRPPRCMDHSAGPKAGGSVRTFLPFNHALPPAPNAPEQHTYGEGTRCRRSPLVRQWRDFHAQSLGKPLRGRLGTAFTRTWRGVCL